MNGWIDAPPYPARSAFSLFSRGLEPRPIRYIAQKPHKFQNLTRSVIGSVNRLIGVCMNVITYMMYLDYRGLACGKETRTRNEMNGMDREAGSGGLGTLYRVGRLEMKIEIK